MRTLNVFVNGRHVALLQEEPSPSGRPQYRLAYLPDTPPAHYISLSLPVSAKPYVVDDIPFALRQNFPEGERLLQLKKLGKVMDISDNFSVLSVIGQNGVGRIPEINLYDATKEGKLTFAKLFQQYGFAQGISGVQNKVLANEDQKVRVSIKGKESLVTQHFILKSFNPEEFPALAENEYWTMLAAKNSGIITADAFLSDDFSTLIVKRFDVLPSGLRLALDEAGTLSGFSNEQKYLASYETVTDLIFKYCSLPQDDALELFRQMVFMVAVKNGDVHLKNFALLSGDGRTLLAPAYDLVCTGAYVDEAKDEFENPAMQLENSRWEKHWWSNDTLLVFGEHMLGLNANQMMPIFEHIEHGLTKTLGQIANASCSNDFANKIKPRLSYLWQHPFDLEDYGEIPKQRPSPKI